MEKTYKRETAWFLIALMAYVAIWGSVEALEVITWPIMFFVGWAFGLDWSTKQGGLDAIKSLRK